MTIILWILTIFFALLALAFFLEENDRDPADSEYLDDLTSRYPSDRL